MSQKTQSNILLGITGSVAAYKTPELVRMLRQQDCLVKVVLTSAAKLFVTPGSLQAVSQHPVYESLLDSAFETSMSHIELARWPDCIIVAPATANFIAKLAAGIADDLLTTLCLATTARIILVPAMNQAMWNHVATKENVYTLINRGIIFLGPDKGEQACGDFGFGRMLEPHAIVGGLLDHLEEPYLQGKRILISAGPTREMLDPVRYISNRSSGKMGYSLAQVAAQLGAEVTLISGPVSLSAPYHCRLIQVETAAQMLQAVQSEIIGQEIFISTAAVANYHCSDVAVQKIKSNQILTLNLEPTIDILKTIASLQPRPFLVGFAAETENIIAVAEKKRLAKNIDLMVVNDVSCKEIGFDSDENEVIVLSNQEPIFLKRAPKVTIAAQLWRIIYKKFFSTRYG